MSGRVDHSAEDEDEDEDENGIRDKKQELWWGGKEGDEGFFLSASEEKEDTGWPIFTASLYLGGVGWGGGGYSSIWANWSGSLPPHWFTARPDIRHGKFVAIVELL